MPPADRTSRDSILKAAISLMSDGKPRTAFQLIADLQLTIHGVEPSMMASVLAREGRGAFKFNPSKRTYTLIVNTTTGSVLRRRIYDTILAVMKDGRPRKPEEIAAIVTASGVTADRSLIFSIMATDGKQQFRFDQRTYTYSITEFIGVQVPVEDRPHELAGAQALARVEESASLQVTNTIYSKEKESVRNSLLRGGSTVPGQPHRQFEDSVEQAQACITSLRVLDGRAMTALPDWAQFFASVGVYTAAQSSQDYRTIVGLAVPARNYAAAFAALGVVTMRALTQSTGIDPEEHFTRICPLPKGTMLKYMKKNRQLRAVFDGPADVDGTPVIRVRIQSNSDASKHERGMTDLLTKEQSLRVEVAGGEEKELTGWRSGAGRKAGQRSLLSWYFGLLDVESYILRSRLECALIGPRNLLEHEICNTPVAVEDSKSTIHEGCLQDIVRVRDYLPDDQAYWSDFFVSRGSAPARPEAHAPAVVVFDGAAGFLKWRDNWRSSNWIVLLDRTEYDFDEAAEQIRTEYRQNRTGEGDARTFPAVPAGVEAVIYQENRQ